MVGNGLLVSVSGWDTDAWLGHFRAAAGDRPVVGMGQPHDPASIAYAAVWKPQPGALAGYQALKAVFNLGAGVDALMADATLPAVPIVRVVDPNLTRHMTHYVTLHVLSYQRRQALHAAAQAERRWISPYTPPPETVRVGIMGMGELGRDVAAMLVRLGFDVAGWSRNGQPVPGIQVHGADALDTFLARTDILVVLLPLTDETRGILDHGLFSKLARDGALGAPVLINAGRGGLQVEGDILSALDDGTLGGATLDVFETEPLPPESPFWSHPQVTVTPHNAADSDPRAISAYVMKQITEFEAGAGLRNLVDLAAGY